MKNPLLSLYSRGRAALSYVEGLSDSFRLSAEGLAEKQAAKHELIDRSIRNAAAMTLVQPCQGQSMTHVAVHDFVKIREAEKYSYDAGVKRAASIKAWHQMV